MKRIAKKAGVKKEVYFIATRYRNEPLNVSFFIKGKGGKQIAEELVEKKRTKEGVKLFAVVPQ